MNDFKNKYFQNSKNFEIKINNRNVKFIEKSSFRDLENIVKHCKLLICCEGAISHVSHSLKKKTISLIQRDRIISTNFWIGHMKNLKTIYRDDICNVSKEILKLNFI